MPNNENKKRPPMGGGHGHGHGMGGGEKAKDFKGTMKNLFEYLKPYRLSMLVVIIFAIGSATFSIVGPKVLGKATTKIFEGLMNKVSGNSLGMDFDYIGKILLILLGLYVISAIFSYIQGFIMSGISQ